MSRIGHRLALLALVAALSGAPPALAAGTAAETFASPEQAVAALVAAARAADPAALLKIYGEAGRGLVLSGDPVADKEAEARFVEHFDEANKILRDAQGRAVLVLGRQEWPFPIPLVQQAGGWQFDPQAGAQEILDRRIGRNELNAMAVCRAYVQAQRDYAADLAAAGKPAEYARMFVSTPGRHDGLYWPVEPGEKESPIGPLMASARAQGYDGAEHHDAGGHTPYHGYYYKILTQQGPAAPGGARDYVVSGRMTGGFALIAFPATYGDSGVMTFMVDQDGVVFQKDLGPDTASLAPAITTFDPDPGWRTR